MRDPLGRHLRHSGTRSHAAREPTVDREHRGLDGALDDPLRGGLVGVDAVRGGLPPDQPLQQSEHPVGDHGLPAEVREQLDTALRVPIYGAAESLNLATAAAVCLYAGARARRG